jgi:hypothetical protein
MGGTAYQEVEKIMLFGLSRNQSKAVWLFCQESHGKAISLLWWRAYDVLDFCFASTIGKEIYDAGSQEYFYSIQKTRGLLLVFAQPISIR